LRAWQRAGAEREALFPAAGELPRKLLLAALQSKTLNHVARRALRIGYAIEPRDEFEILPHRQILIEAEALRHVADMPLDLVGVPADVVAEASALAAVGRQQAAQHADGRRLARTIRPEEAIDRAASHLHRQIADHLARAERFRQAAHIDGDVALARSVGHGLRGVRHSAHFTWDSACDSVTVIGWPTRRLSGLFGRA